MSFLKNILKLDLFDFVACASITINVVIGFVDTNCQMFHFTSKWVQPGLGPIIVAAISWSIDCPQFHLCTECVTHLSAIFSLYGA